jgi:hypothetical protein
LIVENLKVRSVVRKKIARRSAAKAADAQEPDLLNNGEAGQGQRRLSANSAKP